MIRFSALNRAGGVLTAIAAGAVFLAAPALADHKEHRERHEHGEHHGHGPKIEVHDDGRHYKYEYKDRHCKYEYEVDYRTGREKIEQKGDCRGVAPQRAVYYDEGYEHDQGDEPGYDREPPRGGRRLSCNRELIGQVLGGVIGGVAGARVGDGSGRRAATIAGAVIGVIVGGNVGRRMDRSDSACAYQALQFAAPGETVFWRNPDSQIEYGITPQRRSRAADGRECREYEASVIGAPGGRNTSSGTACRRTDGTWEIE
jgi:surface antigen